jgi:hypothetical protein
VLRCAALHVDVVAELVLHDAVWRAVDGVAWERPLAPGCADRRAPLDADNDAARRAVVGALAPLPFVLSRRGDGWRREAVQLAEGNHGLMPALKQIAPRVHLSP